jgi:catechol 2,3-dioxygenase-like lactoylglutathione lyase family enzyme
MPGLLRGLPVTISSFAIVAAAALRPSAQLLNTEAPVIVGHYHLNVTSVDAHKKFWVDTLGGTAISVGSAHDTAIMFPGVYLLLNVQPPTGPTRGTTFDHIGFAVPNVPEVAARAVANGYQRTVGRETKDGAAAPTGGAAVYGRFEYLIGPDGVKVELVTNGDAGAPPIVHHHVHFVNKQYVQMQQWYMKAFDATLRPGQTDFFIGADLPGVGYMLNFFHWELESDLVGTKGRAVDHVGFEVKNLEEFCKRLEEKGIPLTVKLHADPAFGNVRGASLVDPWGTSLELTEGLRALKP